jgi:hypothetical protein
VRRLKAGLNRGEKRVATAIEKWLSVLAVIGASIAAIMLNNWVQTFRKAVR